MKLQHEKHQQYVEPSKYAHVGEWCLARSTALNIIQIQFNNSCFYYICI